MTNQESGARRGIFGISAPPRERTASPVLPRPEVRPSPVSPEPPKKSLHERLARVFKNRLVRLGLATGVIGLGGSAVGYEAYQNIPAVHKAVDQQFLERIGIKTPEVTVPDTFDNTKDRGIIGENNIVRLPQEEIDKQFPTPFSKTALINPTIISLSQQIPPGADKSMYPDIPIRVGDNKSTLQLQYFLDLSKSSNPTANIEFSKSFSGSSKAERDAFQGKGIYDGLTFQNVPGGTIIISPIDGFLLFARDPSQPIPPNGSDNEGAFIDFTSPEGNKYRLFVSGSTTKDFQDGLPSNQTGFVFKPLTDAPLFAYQDNNKAEKTGIVIKKGESILKLIQPRDGVPIEKVSIGVMVMSPTGEYVPTNIELFTTPDNKLVSRTE